jgi:superfamily II DNA/RNA helicase
VSLTFAELGVPADLVSVLQRRDITTPTPIQAASLPDALGGADVCGCAPTGSGKTLAFGLAMVVRTSQAKPRRPRGLVLVPTRELAAQVAEELTTLAGVRRLRVTAVYGGAAYERQKRALGRGADIVVATPGRLEDLLSSGHLTLADVAFAVVDEADRMADMGFLPAVRRLLDAARADRQTLLFSATLDGDVDVLVRRYQRNPKRHSVANADDGAKVEHLFWRAPRERRVELTAGLIERHDRALVFCRTRHGADRLARQLGAAGIDTAAIHGSRTQRQRERALDAFKSGRIQALVATDVAARGIHVDGVPCVVHFDPAGDHKDYAHRSGRTGRAGAAGTVVTLVADEHRAAVRTLQRAAGLPEGVDQPDVAGRRVTARRDANEGTARRNQGTRTQRPPRRRRPRG